MPLTSEPRAPSGSPNLTKNRHIDLSTTLRALDTIEHDQRDAALLYVRQSLDLLDPEWRRTDLPLVRDAISFPGFQQAEETPTSDAFLEMLAMHLGGRVVAGGSIDGLGSFPDTHPHVCAWVRHALTEVRVMEEDADGLPMSAEARRDFDATLDLWGAVIDGKRDASALVQHLEVIDIYTDNIGAPAHLAHVWRLMIQVVSLQDPLGAASRLRSLLLGRYHSVLAMDIMGRPVQERIQEISEGFEEASRGGFARIAGFVAQQVVQTGSDLYNLRSNLTDSVVAHRERRSDIERYHAVYDDSLARFVLSRL